MVRGRSRQFVTCIAIAAATLLAGCETLSMTALGIGGSAVVTQKLNGTPSRTFTLPLYMVRSASISALKRMGIEIKDHAAPEPIENREVIRASAGGREIEVELESITPQATRMRVVARNGSLFFYDGATATEIIVQTEKGLGV